MKILLAVDGSDYSLTAAEVVASRQWPERGQYSLCGQTAVYADGKKRIAARQRLFADGKSRNVRGESRSGRGSGAHRREQCVA